MPDTFGYYWVKRKGHKVEMRYLCPGGEYKNDSRSVEAWECPGIVRFRLDLQNMPSWNWTKIEKPKR